MTTTQSPRVCVIGAGIAGLVTAKVLRDDGFDVCVCEQLPTIGGVWAPSRTYPGLRANNPRETYAFSDFDYPATADDFPSAAQVRTYLNAYVDHFHLRSLLRMSTEVRHVSRRTPASPFEVTLRSTGGTVTETTLSCDFVAVCNGVFSQPHVPSIPGRERFAGQVVHSSEVTNHLTFAGKRVVVVGAGKSALDCATWAAEHARTCTWVYRTPHWMVPRYFFGRIRADRMILTRFSELFVPYHSPSRFESLLHARGRALVNVWWRIQTRLLRDQLRLPDAVVPDRPLPSGFETIGIGVEFYDLLRKGKLTARRARVAEFNGTDTIALDNGESVAADAVIFATGWRQRLDFLDDALRAEVQRDGKFHLYRHILPPREPRLGFVGYASSIACQLVSEISAHWLSQAFRGELALPAVAEMDREIGKVLAWCDEVFPGRSEGYFIGPFLAHYLDDLVRDMGLNTARADGRLSEYFAPLWPSRYRNVAAERRARRRQGAGPIMDAIPA